MNDIKREFMFDVPLHFVSIFLSRINAHHQFPVDCVIAGSIVETDHVGWVVVLKVSPIDFVNGRVIGDANAYLSTIKPAEGCGGGDDLNDALRIERATDHGVDENVDNDFVCGHVILGCNELSGLLSGILYPSMVDSG